MGKKTVIVVSLLLALSLIFAGCGKKTEVSKETKKVDYPTKPIKIVVFTVPGTGSDVMSRKIADVLNRKYGWKVEVVNNPAESSAAALKQVWNAPHDGYTILGQTENILGLSVYGLTDKTMKDWVNFEMAHEASLIVVRTDSPYKTIEALVEAAKQNPNSIKLGHNGVGRSFYLKAKLIEKLTGAQFDLKEYKANEVANALLKGEVDAISVPTQLIDEAKGTGKIRPLVVTDSNSFDLGGNIGKVESITKYYPEAKKYMPLDGTIGLSMPADTPKEIVNAFGKAFDEVMNDSEMKEFVEKRGNVPIVLWGDNAKSYMNSMESSFAWLAKEIGLAKVDPESLGIPKLK